MYKHNEHAHGYAQLTMLSFLIINAYTHMYRLCQWLESKINKEVYRIQPFNTHYVFRNAFFDFFNKQLEDDNEQNPF